MSIKDFFVQKKLAAQDRLSDISDDFSEGSGFLKLGLIALGVYLLLAIGVGFYWSSEPDSFSVRELVAQSESNAGVMVGVSTTATLNKVASTLLDKPGGYLTNDIMPPGVWLDNIPSWEYGVLIQIRDMAKALREAFSRSQSQSTEDSALAMVESRFNFDNNSWAIPASESEYREGIKYLGDYLQRLQDKDVHNAQFYARADNLRYWLSTVETRLGSLSQRLSASVGQRRLNTDLANEERARQSTYSPNEVQVKTPFFEVDNIFYEARGSAWAILHFLKAIEIDFEDVLKKKNALVSVRQIIRELEATQSAVFSPMILNGDGFGFLANHSLIMASYISRANAGIIDLRDLLSQG